MRLGKELQNAINIVAKLNATPRRAADIAIEIGLTADQVLKVSTKLRLAGLCQGMRGFGGGLSKTRHVTATELFEALNRPIPVRGKAIEVQEQIDFLLNNIWL